MMRETKLLPSFLIAFAISIATTVTTSADASVSVALSLDEVAKTSTIVARVVPRGQSAAWENGRIVTTTHLGVERVIGGSNVPSEIDVRTLGGRIGAIGQIVDGEAQFTENVPSIVFLVPRSSDGALFVSGRAQGQLVVVRAKEGHEVVRVRNTGALVARRVATDVVTVTALDGRDANDAMREAARAWERTHAR